MVSLRVHPFLGGELFDLAVEEACIEAHRGAHDVTVNVKSGGELVVSSELGERRVKGGV